MFAGIDLIIYNFKFKKNELESYNTTTFFTEENPPDFTSRK